MTTSPIVEHSFKLKVLSNQFDIEKAKLSIDILSKDGLVSIELSCFFFWKEKPGGRPKTNEGGLALRCTSRKSLKYILFLGSTFFFDCTLDAKVFRRVV